MGWRSVCRKWGLMRGHVRAGRKFSQGLVTGTHTARTGWPKGVLVGPGILTSGPLLQTAPGHGAWVPLGGEEQV